MQFFNELLVSVEMFGNSAGTAPRRWCNKHSSWCCGAMTPTTTSSGLAGRSCMQFYHSVSKSDTIHAGHNNKYTNTTVCATPRLRSYLLLYHVPLPCPRFLRFRLPNVYYRHIGPWIQMVVNSAVSVSQRAAAVAGMARTGGRSIGLWGGCGGAGDGGELELLRRGAAERAAGR